MREKLRQRIVYQRESGKKIQWIKDTFIVFWFSFPSHKSTSFSEAELQDPDIQVYMNNANKSQYINRKTNKQTNKTKREIWTKQSVK